VIVPDSLGRQCAVNAFVIGIVVLSGCHGGDTGARSSPPSSSTSVASSDSLRLIVNAELQDLTLVNQFSISDNDELFVLQSRDARIRVFDTAGTPLRSIGARGAGPGEFERLAQQHGFSADSLWTWDRDRRRLTMFTTDGKFVRSDVIPWPNYTDVTGNSESDGIEHYFAIATPQAVLQSGEVALLLGDDRGRYSVHARRPDGTGWRRVVDLPSQSAVVTAADRRATEIPWFHSPAWSFSRRGDKLVAATSDTTTEGGSAVLLQIVTTLTGDVRRVTIPVDGRRISESSKDSAIQSVLERPITRAQRAAMLGEVPRRIPDYYPFFLDVVMGTDNTIWLLRADSARVQTWSAFDEDGVLLRQVTLPRNMRLVSASLDGIWGALRRDDGLDDIVVYR
jgi:WD40 repeat protein